MTTPPAPHGPRGVQGFIVALLLLGGLLILLYPLTANWFSERNHNNEITGYTGVVKELSEGARSERLLLADEYNSRMPRGPLRDPFAVPTNDEEAERDAYASYEQLLRVSDNGVIGNISYPRLGVTLPVYHGTDDDVISRGAGHLYGSSLPVGGPSTHSVLTAHSGLAHAALFTPILRANLGDTFTVEVLGEKHFYRVDQVRTVEPNDTRALQVLEGRDLVSLITCTPVGVNSHRLLVTGTRIASPEGDGRQELTGETITGGFPWWLVYVAAGSAVTFYIVRRVNKRTKTITDSSENRQGAKHAK
ncbi:class C sortase [Leucobacter sp. HY1910]